MEARPVWLGLLALIEHVIRDSERPAGTKLFRALGPRRLRMAQRQLQRERDTLLQIAARWELSIDSAAPLPAPHPWDNLADDYLAMAQAYRRAAGLAERRGDPVALSWLLGRARVHEEHSRFLRG